jgi:hypothetical protein
VGQKELSQSVSRKLAVLYRQIRAAHAQFIEQSNWERIAPDKFRADGNTPASMEHQQCHSKRGGNKQGSRKSHSRNSQSFSRSAEA